MAASYDDVMIEELLNENAALGIKLTEWEERFLSDMEEKTDDGKELSDDEERKVVEIYENHYGRR